MMKSFLQQQSVTNTVKGLLDGISSLKYLKKLNFKIQTCPDLPWRVFMRPFDKIWAIEFANDGFSATINTIILFRFLKFQKNLIIFEEEAIYCEFFVVLGVSSCVLETTVKCCFVNFCGDFLKVFFLLKIVIKKAWSDRF